MKKQLLDVIFASDKRKNVLLLLKDGSKEMKFLLNTLETTRQALLPQIKILEDHYLVSHHADTYELTSIGKLIVDKMFSLSGPVEIFDRDIDYWGTHKLDFIPTDLLKRISELGDCKVVVPHVTEMYEIDRKFSEATKWSKSYFVITTFIHPSILMMIPELLNNKVNLNVIVSPDLINKIRTDHSEDLTDYIQNKLVNVFVFPKKFGFKIISCNDHCLMLALLTDNGGVDNKYLLCDGSGAVKWGKALFEHYLKDSIPITEI